MTARHHLWRAAFAVWASLLAVRAWVSRKWETLLADRWPPRS